MSIVLSKTDTSLLLGAAEQDGCLILPVHLKPATAQRLIGRLTRDGLVKAIEEGGGVQYRLAQQGYEAVGVRRKRVRPSVIFVEPKVGPNSKKKLVRNMLLRAEGATLAELVGGAGEWRSATRRQPSCGSRASII